MEDSKLTKILSTFSKEEIGLFEKFVNSPFFSIGRDVSGLYSLLKKYYPHFNSNELKKENIFIKLFPGENFNEKKLKNLSSDLTRLAEQFLVYNLQTSNELGNKLLLSEQFKNRNLDKYFQSTISMLEKKIDDTLFSSEQGFSQKEKYLLLKDDFQLSKNDFEGSINSRLKYTELFTLSFLIKFLLRMRDKKTVISRYNSGFENPLFDSLYENLDFGKLIDSLRKKDYPFLWLLEIYYNLSMCAPGTEETSYYDKLKKLFLDNIGYFSPREKDQIFSVLYAYCSRRAEKADMNFFREGFEISREMLKHSSYSEKEYLHVIIYRGMMLFALWVKEYKWLEEFIGTYTGKLRPEYRENMKYLAKANLDFAQGDFERALENISEVKYDIFIFKFDVKNLMLKIYYEMNLFDPAFSLIDAFKHFLSENKEHAEIYHQQYGNFLRIYTRLLKARESGKTGEMDLLSKEIDVTEALASRIWLKEKIAELSK